MAKTHHGPPYAFLEASWDCRLSTGPALARDCSIVRQQVASEVSLGTLVVRLDRALLRRPIGGNHVGQVAHLRHRRPGIGLAQSSSGLEAFAHGSGVALPPGMIDTCSPTLPADLSSRARQPQLSIGCGHLPRPRPGVASRQRGAHQPPVRVCSQTLRELPLGSRKLFPGNAPRVRRGSTHRLIGTSRLRFGRPRAEVERRIRQFLDVP
jgi:hypothetical protein